jgi:hypothetical protein
MLHRTFRSAAVILLNLGFLMGIPGQNLSAATGTDDLQIRFEDIGLIMRAGSPREKIIAQEVAAATAARDRSRQWSNPSLAYDHEEYDLFREWQVSLSKRFDQPFSQGDLSDGWQGMVTSAELRGKQDSENNLVEMKAGYVRLQLMEGYLDHLARFSGVVDLISDGAKSRHTEGVLSGSENRLISLAAYSVEATSRRVRQDYSRIASTWRAEMGLPSSSDLQLVTPITFQAWPLDTREHYEAMLVHRPGHLANATLAGALGKRVEASKPSLLPGFDIYGGYKSIADQIDGFVAGIAVDLPLFDGKAGAAKQLEAQRLIVENRMAMELSLSRGEAASLVGSIREAQMSLARFTGDFNSAEPLTDSLLLQYREGTLALDALLAAIQIEAAALENYYNELAAYYLNIFRLEAISGATIVRFEQ